MDDQPAHARKILELLFRLVAMGASLLSEYERKRADLIARLLRKEEREPDDLVALAHAIRWRPRGEVRIYLRREAQGSKAKYLDEKLRVLLCAILQTVKSMVVPARIRFSPGISDEVGGFAIREDGTRPIPIKDLSAAEFDWWFRKEVCRQAASICRDEMQASGILGDDEVETVGYDDPALAQHGSSSTLGDGQAPPRTVAAARLPKLDANDRRRILADSLTGKKVRLSPLEQRVVILYRQEQGPVSDEEAAVRLKSTRNSVRSAWRRIRKKLRARIRR